MASIAFLLLWVSSFNVAVTSQTIQNVTFYRIPTGSKVAMCGYYSLTYEMWANGTWAYLFITDTACSASTGTPCQPSTTPALAPLSCVGRAACQGQTSQLSSTPLCLVVLNQNVQGVLEVNLYVTGTLAPAGGGGGSSGSSSGSSGLSHFEIVLISVGSAAGFVILAGLTALVVWLKCCKPPPRPQALDASTGAGDLDAKAVMAAAQMGPHGVGLQGMSAPQPLLSPATVYPYPQYGGAPYGMVPMVTPYGGMPYPLSPYGGLRSPSALAPLPPQAYSALSEPPRSPPPLLVLPPLLPPRKAAAAAAAPSLPPPQSPLPPPAQSAQQQGAQPPASPSPPP